MSERISRRSIIALLAGGALGLGLVSKTKIGKMVLSQDNTSKAAQLRQQLGLNITGSEVFEEPIAQVETPKPQAVEDTQKVEILSKPNWPREILIKSTRQGPSDRPFVGLTVDDGYLARNQVLDMLIAKNVRPTLFVIGSIAKQDPDFIHRACDAGFEFGNHTYSHSGDLTKMSEATIYSEIKRDIDTLVSIDERANPAPFLRTPGGSRNSLTDQIGADLGLRTILWNISGDAGDHTADWLVNYYLRESLDKLPKPWGAIMLTHFHPRTPEMLSAIIDGIRARGMEPVSLSKLFEDGRV